MGNIFNHNREIFQIRINKDNYWDFHLSTDYKSNGSISNELTTRCLSSYIDINNPNCVWFDDLYSDENYKWKQAVNNGIELNSIGYTGIDNGIVKFEKDCTNSRNFLKLYTQSSISVKKDDLRLHLQKVNGNNQLYNYSVNIVEKDNVLAAELNGGFYQGFFKTKCNEYQILPDSIDNGLTIEITLNKADLQNDKETLNSKHTDNEGFFFYIGTRAENKWWKFYKVDNNFDKQSNTYNNDGYFIDGIITNDINNVVSYIKPIEKEEYELDNDYVIYNTPCCEYYQSKNSYSNLNSDYIKNNNCSVYFSDDYITEDEIIDDDTKFKTEENYDLYQPNIKEITTDNKFITFNRTKEGFNINSYEPNDSIILYDINMPEIENYFTLFNRTDNGYNIDNIDNLISKENKQYNVINDITNNALGFRITNDGKIGYRYIVSDCNNEDGYSVTEEYTKDKIIFNDKWFSISISIVKINSNSMKLFIYCNGKLKLISKEMQLLKLRKLNDLYSKQEAVPYNISIGGGTQGLCDVIYHNFRTTPSEVLPLEKYFAGTFIGYIKDFKLYSCSLTQNEIMNNANNTFNQFIK